MAYRIFFVSRAERGLKRLSADVRDRIISEINSLAEDPVRQEPSNSQALTISTVFEKRITE